MIERSLSAPAGRTFGLDELLEQAREMAEDASLSPARRWKEAGIERKVLGHFQVYFPEEIAHAAGVLPIKLVGAGSATESRSADSRLASFVCAILRSTLELGLSGTADFVDAMYVPSICDAARSLAGIWAQNFPAHTRIMYLPQNAASRCSIDYLRHEYEHIRGEIEAMAGRRVSDEDLQQSIAVYNLNRRLIRELYRIKRDTPWLLSASECYALVRIGCVLPKEEHNRILQQAIGLLPSRTAKRQDKIRVVFEGGFCEQPPLEMLQTIEESCYVVDDDLLIGLRWFTDDVSLDGDPLRRLAEAYIDRSSYSCVQHDPRKPNELMLLERMQRSGAEAAIVAAAKMCEPGLDEQVACVKELEKENRPFLIVEFEEKMTAFEQLKMQVETFVESILFD